MHLHVPNRDGFDGPNVRQLDSEAATLTLTREDVDIVVFALFVLRPNIKRDLTKKYEPGSDQDQN